jgi:hypothetical protein
MEKAQARTTGPEAVSVRIHSYIWATTQPIEEPEPCTQLAKVFDCIGWDGILFAIDYSIGILRSDGGVVAQDD